jgi:nitrite reductase/ring-hydroxylating ferredoxin subunit/alkylhydroperoxidase/carboxymuconolactone decarboxylase family protein YurZ
MSDALNYLLKTRPDAMKPYFKFVKEAGAHLDPKTRSLISVITKVAAQSESGFRQYLPRALRDGASANEILDALLMAFPVLGLSKVTWAIDILLDMDIPEFNPELLDMQQQWHGLIAVAELEVGQVRRIDCDGRELFIYRGVEDIRVYDSRCPHQVTNIPHLALQGTTLTCPKHNWAFDITSGDCIAVGSRPLNQYQTRIEADQLEAYW